MNEIVHRCSRCECEMIPMRIGRGVLEGEVLWLDAKKHRMEITEGGWHRVVYGYVQHSEVCTGRRAS